ncbi:hypothetical protein [Sphingopyxis flava]|uniref:Uncharacterized protein n=1 Tax=Sphingopyxis flava TaxID=1507287 RepID=A0A1T4ZVX3_9SPHN|nr:hypothetical protein [Sphingopyxis flava]SKB26846.1 hypothetical protein SAMN06295937_1001243 [Sphingopyxis flava]
MTDRPILFSAPMVRALLEGRKTQTRRILNPQPGDDIDNAGDCETIIDMATGQEIHARFAVGDRLYVREEWFTTPAYDDLAPSEMGGDEPLRYKADDATFNWTEADGSRVGRRRAGMHMPRWASRLTLTVTEVRVERLQECSEVDAVQEGVTLIEESCEDPVEAYAALWNSINGAGAWEANPWVAAVTFTVEQRNIDA